MSEKEFDSTNKELINILVSNVLKKHGIDKSNVQLDEQEKERVKSVFNELQEKVEQFLTTQQSEKTEHDFEDTETTINTQTPSTANHVNHESPFTKLRRKKKE
ncbi:hypothetical protein [Desertibacillus haloalkaliphilus]|uniref:hypothetical protein n=1 Tax=Desertibacillus haloalkaliphilus TaxID=1328930 RepID=UPI001C2526C7|nr:hypothetical protein [Desertibacillus haloalkaliphilus]MBU8906889.1 hypothetical protein [Desertibacillus haloalkaliphilus]